MYEHRQFTCFEPMSFSFLFTTFGFMGLVLWGGGGGGVVVVNIFVLWGGCC